jgi:hypothetical protein
MIPKPLRISIFPSTEKENATIITEVLTCAKRLYHNLTIFSSIVGNVVMNEPANMEKLTETVIGILSIIGKFVESNVSIICQSKKSSIFNSEEMEQKEVDSVKALS